MLYRNKFRFSHVVQAIQGSLFDVDVLADHVGGDTGVAHLAAAVGVATVTLFGPTDRRLTAPRGRGARVLDRAVPCAPCFLPTCPIDHICLTRIDPETVLHEVRLAVA